MKRPTWLRTLLAALSGRPPALPDWNGAATPEAIRERNLAFLAARGFTVAPSLPTLRDEAGAAIRPAAEIAGRLWAMSAQFHWVAVAGNRVPDERFQHPDTRRELRTHLTDEELELFEDSRADAQTQRDTIGWRLENMWALAWTLGFHHPPALQGMIGPDVIDSLLRFAVFPDGTVADLLPRTRLRPPHEINGLEDLFYCAHNAVRSAQLGSATVPLGFHPLADGGGVHERRHALTWVCSPGVAWDETDLST